MIACGSEIISLLDSAAAVEIGVIGTMSNIKLPDVAAIDGCFMGKVDEDPHDQDKFEIEQNSVATEFLNARVAAKAR